ncbi:MAG: hypothetical protein IKU83_02855 [Lachnospiraceae bacterium]|nr:hypothetical protein [Lachnospiraceae bacterium]
MKRTWLGMVALILCLTGCGAKTEVEESLAKPQETIERTEENTTAEMTQEATQEAVITKRVPVKIQGGYINPEGELEKRPAAFLEYNEKGELAKVLNYDELNKINSDWQALQKPYSGEDMTFVFDNGQLVEMSVMYYDKLEATYEFVYDENGRKQEATWKTKEATCYVSYVYDEETELLMEKRYRSGEDGFDTICYYYYDEAGILREKMQESWRSGWKTKTERYLYFYDESGRVVNIVWEERDGSTGRLEWIYTTVYEYDEEGMIMKERVERNVLDGSGDVDWSEDKAVLELYYEYDEIVIETENSEDEQPTMSGAVDTPTQDVSAENGVLLYYTLETEDRMGNIHFVEPPYSPMYQYDDGGKLIGIKNAGLSDEMKELTLTTIGGDAILSYDDQKRLSQVDLGNGRAKVNIRYDERGLRVSDMITTDQGMYEVVYTYEDEIDYLLSKIYCPDGYNLYRVFYLYDSHGVVEERKVEHYANGSWLQTNTSQLEYDKEGRLIRETEQVEGKQIHYTATITTEYAYNDAGKLIKKEVLETPTLYPDGSEKYPNHIRKTYCYVYGEAE